MNKYRLIEVFEELLSAYETSEIAVNSEFSINPEQDENFLEHTIVKYKENFYTALGGCDSKKQRKEWVDVGKGPNKTIGWLF